MLLQRNFVLMSCLEYYNENIDLNKTPVVNSLLLALRFSKMYVGKTNILIFSLSALSHSRDLF